MEGTDGSVGLKVVPIDSVTLSDGYFLRAAHAPHHGVMEALIEGAAGAAAAAGAPALEAYPVDTAVPGHTRNMFPGVAVAFARHGFRVVARHKPERPVMRRDLGGPGVTRGRPAAPGVPG